MFFDLLLLFQLQDQNDKDVLDKNGKPCIHSDGTGYISEDLAQMCPIIYKGKSIKSDNIQVFLVLPWLFDLLLSCILFNLVSLSYCFLFFFLSRVRFQILKHRDHVAKSRYVVYIPCLSSILYFVYHLKQVVTILIFNSLCWSSFGCFIMAMLLRELFSQTRK